MRYRVALAAEEVRQWPDSEAEKTSLKRDVFVGRHRLGLSSSGVAFSARSSLRIEVTRTLSVRTGFLAFFGVYSMWRDLALDLDVSPFLSVAANSPNLPKTMQRCHSVCERYSPVSLLL